MSKGYPYNPSDKTLSHTLPCWEETGAEAKLSFEEPNATLTLHSQPSKNKG